MGLSIRLLVLPLLLAVAGCGGGGGGGDGGGGGGGSQIQMAASYRTDFTIGASGTPDASIIIFVQTSGATSVVIANSFEPLFSGSAQIASGSFTVDASGTGGTVHVTGTVQDGPPAAMVVTLTGPITNSVTVPKTAGAGVFPFAGSYSAQYVGSEPGDFSFTVSTIGEVTGTLHSSILGSAPMNGTVDIVGSINLTTGNRSSWSGVLYFPPGTPKAEVANGIWNFNFNNLGGTWEAAQS